MTSHPDTGPRLSGLTRLLTLSSLLWLVALLTVSNAQITMDGSLGPAGPLAGPDYRIGAELGQIRGGNLFHSFGDFNVPTGGSAIFTGPSTTTNILSRVTGGQPSTIDGLLRSEIAGANLFLLNPSGVLFGSNTSLDINGSFHVSTADFLRFTDGATFSANLGQASVLTVALPAAFGFLGNSPAPLTIQGSTLQVPDGKLLSMVGGDIRMVGGRLQAPSGGIQLTSVAAPGEVGFRPLELAPELQMDGFARLGRIELSQGAVVATIGEENRNSGAVEVRSGMVMFTGGAYVDASTVGSSRGSGWGGNVTVMASEAIIFAGVDSGLWSNTYGGGEAGRITVSTPLLIMRDEAVINTASQSGSSGHAGAIDIRAGTLTFTGGGRIVTSSFGGGRGGELTVAATDTLTIAGWGPSNPSGLFSNASGSGAAGRVVVSAPRVSLLDGGVITASTVGAGRGGTVIVTATEAITIAGHRPSDQAGISTSRLSTNTNGGGDAGRIAVSAPLVSLLDEGTIEARAFSRSHGDGGEIGVRAGTLTLANGGNINIGTGGTGGGGRITVLATDTIVITGLNPSGRSPRFGSGIFSENEGPRPGGDIHVTAPHIQLRDGGHISANSSGSGAAGHIMIQVGETFRSHNGRVRTQTLGSGGGTITLQAGRLVQLIDTEFSTSVRGGGSDAGNIALSAPSIVLEGSQISANAFGGRGGNIRIRSEVFLADPASVVNASSTLGINGIVDIQAPVTSLGGTLAPLPQAFVNVAALLPARCAARFSGGQTSSLAVGWRDGLPLEPNSPLPSPLVLEERLEADLALTGEARRLRPSRLALLAADEKRFPRVRGTPMERRCGP